MNETFDWDDLRLFLAVARHSGLAGATASTGKSAATLGRRVLALERRLGLELFVRTPRGYTLTDAGADLLAEATALEARIRPMLDKADNQPSVVTVSAGAWVSHLLCCNMGRILGEDTTALRFVAADHVLDILHREAQIGIRNQRPEGRGLAGRRTGRVAFAVYGIAPEVSAWALPLTNTPSARWLKSTMPPAPVIEVSHPRNALDLTLAGQTRAVLPTFIANRHDTLIPLSEPIDELAHDQWLVTHHEDRFLPDVRRTIDRIHTVLHHCLRSSNAPDRA